MTRCYPQQIILKIWGMATNATATISLCFVSVNRFISRHDKCFDGTTSLVGAFNVSSQENLTGLMGTSLH